MASTANPLARAKWLKGISSRNPLRKMSALLISIREAIKRMYSDRAHKLKIGTKGNSRRVNKH